MSHQDPMTTVAQPTPSRSAGGELLELVKTVVTALAIALFLRVIFFQPFTIPSDSMEPALKVGDYIIVSKWDYGWSRHSLPFAPPLFHGRILEHQAKRGDIVVFKLPRDTKQVYVKRVIGVPGDRIQVKRGQVFINDKPIVQTRMGQATDPDEPDVVVDQLREARPDGKTYITFDRGQGHDGDNTGVYVVPKGHYFMMGDNRDNSLDSRWPAAQGGVDFVPAENLVGKARFILASWKGGASIFKPWTWVLRFDPHRMLHGLT
jgi:signal peptidase I